MGLAGGTIRSVLTQPDRGVADPRAMVLLLLSLAVLVACGAKSMSVPCTNDSCIDPAMPYCVDGACVACDGASTCTPDLPRCSPDISSCVACVGNGDCGAYPSMPYCAPDGTCVGCYDSVMCTVALPYCDPAEQTCRGCEADTECASNVCDQSTGTCIDAASVIYASPGGSGQDCSQAMPCAIISAFQTVSVARNIIRLLPGTYTDDISFGGGKTAFVHADGAMISITSATQAIEVTDGAVLHVQGLAISNPMQFGIVCAPTATTAPVPTLDLDQVTIAAQYGINATPCKLTIASPR